MPITIDKALNRALLHSHQSGDIQTTTTTVTSGTTASAATVILVNAASAALTVSLPQASTVLNKNYMVKKIDSSVNAVTVDPYLSETIDGETTMVLSYKDSAIHLVSDGSNWYIV